MADPHPGGHPPRRCGQTGTAVGETGTAVGETGTAVVELGHRGGGLASPRARELFCHEQGELVKEG